MCGGNLQYKNVVVSASVVSGVADRLVPINLTFVPDTVEVTYLSYSTTADSPVGIYSLFIDFTSDALAQLTTNASVALYQREMHNTFDLPTFFNSQFNVVFRNVLTGAAPASGTINVSVNLLFSKKMTM